MSWVLGVVWTVTNILFIAYHVIYSLPAKTKRNMQRETMKMIAKTKEPFEAPEFEAMEDEMEEEFGKRRTTVRFGGDDDDDHGWSSGSSLSKSALKSIQVKIHFKEINFLNCNITQFAFKESPESKRSIQSVDRVADVTLPEQNENPAFSENNEEVSFEHIYIIID